MNTKQEEFDISTKVRYKKSIPAGSISGKKQYLNNQQEKHEENIMANSFVLNYYGKKIDALEKHNTRLVNELQKIREELEKVIFERDKLREDIKILEDSIAETTEGQGGLGPK